MIVYLSFCVGVPAAPSKPMVSMVTSSSVRVRFTFMDLGSGILEGVTINVTTGGVSHRVMFIVSKETNVTQVSTCNPTILCVFVYLVFLPY